ncbi:unnamed protein product [Cylicocyclus nassatus]|uniref:Uncharacterized protein n=1 Tax=Cylicocyclus nassatus TaxID=53992 RepID=A0AA36DQR6_CYLNA|nr:unnamed protein product [Cylicocyclus nassatus]
MSSTESMKNFILPLFVIVVCQEYPYIPQTDDESLAPCPSDYTDGDDGQCYKLYTNNSNYADASDRCQQEGSNLVSIYDKQKNSFIVQMAKSAGLIIWIGLKCINPYGGYPCVWEGDLQQNLPRYTNFFEGNPNSIGECVLLMIGGEADGKWVSANCEYMRIGFICQVARKKLCGDYTEYKEGRKCYKHISRNLTLEEAEQHCQLDCGHLASIHNIEENSFVYNMLKDHELAYAYAYAYLGLTVANDEFSWMDNTTFDYDNFGVNNTALGRCVAMSLEEETVDAAEWISAPCDHSLPFVCQRARGACFNITSYSELPLPTMAPGSCGTPQFFEQNGTIYSPGYPEFYRGLKSCFYIMTVSPGGLVRIRFLHLNIHPRSTIKLYNSVIDIIPSDTVPLQTPPTKYFQSSTNVMKMVFVSPPQPQGPYYEPIEYPSAWKAEFSEI